MGAKQSRVAETRRAIGEYNAAASDLKRATDRVTNAKRHLNELAGRPFKFQRCNRDEGTDHRCRRKAVWFCVLPDCDARLCETCFSDDVYQACALMRFDPLTISPPVDGPYARREA